jgi:penicillin-binding protein 2
MTELKNNERELHLFRVRLTLLGSLVFVCFGLLLARLVWLQVIRHSDYMAQAEDNRIAVVPIQPNRGLILDRNGVVLARNYSAYTLEITPSKLRIPLDEMIDQLATIVEVTPKDRRRFRKLMDESKNFASIPLRTRLSDEEVARFAANRFRYPGVEVQARLFRNYPLGETASHVIGFIGRINQREARRSRNATTRPTTTAPTTSARKAWKRATRSTCTASPATRRSKCRPAAGRSARCRARRPRPAAT